MYTESEREREDKGNRWRSKISEDSLLFEMNRHRISILRSHRRTIA